MSQRRGFVRRRLPPVETGPYLSNDQVEIIFNQMIRRELDAETPLQPSAAFTEAHKSADSKVDGSSDAPDTADPLPKSRRPNKR